MARLTAGCDCLCASLNASSRMMWTGDSYLKHCNMSEGTDPVFGDLSSREVHRTFRSSGEFICRWTILLKLHSNETSNIHVFLAAPFKAQFFFMEMR